jgi:hypothetical protein
MRQEDTLDENFKASDPVEPGTLSIEQYAEWTIRNLFYLDGFAAAINDESGNRLRGKIHAMKCDLKRVRPATEPV